MGLILAAVGTGLTQWARFETEREFPDDARSAVSNGRTYKTQVYARSTTLLFLQHSFVDAMHCRLLFALLCPTLATLLLSTLRVSVSLND